MRLASVLALALLVALVALSASKTVKITKMMSHQWTELDSRPAQGHMKSLTIALKQRNLEKLEELFWEVSNPDSSAYGKYMTPEELSEIVAPVQKDIDSVVSFFVSHGAQDVRVSRSKDVIKMTMAVADIESAFGVTMKHYKHTSGRMIIRSSQRVTEFPSAIAQSVHIIHGLHDFPPLMKSRKTKEQTFAPLSAQEKHGVLIQRVSSRGNSESVKVYFTPVCIGGPQGTDPTCGGQILSYVISAFYSQKNETISLPFEPSALTCDKLSGSFVCSAVLKVSSFEFLTSISVSSHFKQGHVSNSYDFPVAATAPIVPQSIIQLYNIDKEYQRVTPGFKQSVVEFEEQYYSPSDLSQFFALMGLDGNATPVEVVGPNTASQPGGEANLDIQWMMAMAPRVPMVFWSIPENSTLEIDDVLTWAYALGNTTNPPIVNSLSYGMTAANVDTYLGPGYLARSDVEFQKLALMGISVIFADGDQGAGSLGDPPMLDPDCKTHLNPDWPAHSPYVTAVGATYATPLSVPLCYLPIAQGGIDCTQAGMPMGEVGISLENGMGWTTGGGFSDTQKRPQFQDAFVSRYLSTSANLPPQSFFNANGRAYPDVSAIGHNLMTVLGGQVIPIDGTSASAPIFAGIVSLLNSARIAAGKPPLGFLNPLLYKIASTTPEAFNDVVVGVNRCSEFYPSTSYGSCCPYGYSAAVGWDPVGGLGSPNFGVLVEQVLQY